MDLIVDFPIRTAPFSLPRRCSFAEVASPLLGMLMGNGGHASLQHGEATMTDGDDTDASRLNQGDTGEDLIVDFPEQCSRRLRDAATDKSRVAFHDFSEVCHVENWSTNPEVKSTYWYTEADLHAFQRNRDQSVAMMRMIQRLSGVRNRNTDDASSNSKKNAYLGPTMTKYAQTRMEQANTTEIGLEHHIDTTFSWTEISIRREEHCQSVLVEQWKHRGIHVCTAPAEAGVEAQGGCERQWQWCQDAIARVSREGSEWSRTRARVLGTLHAENKNEVDDDGRSYQEQPSRKSILGQYHKAGYNKLEVPEGPSTATPPSA